MKDLLKQAKVIGQYRIGQYIDIVTRDGRELNVKITLVDPGGESIRVEGPNRAAAYRVDVTCNPPKAY